MSKNPPMPTPIRPLPALYAPPRHPAPIDLPLAGNEGAPPIGLDVSLSPADFARYPSTSPFEAEIAARFGVRPEQVLVTAGGDDALARAFRAVAGPGRPVVLPSPTFSMLPRFAAAVGAPVVEVPWTDAWPVDGVVSAAGPQTAAIAVVSPNNPCGRTVSTADLRRVATAVPAALILVDAAYAEYADDDLTQTALGLPNAIVFRTLSKAWGLAGLRVGYALGSQEHIAWLRASGPPYPCSAASLCLARRWWREGQSHVQASVRAVRIARGRVTDTLRDLGVPVEASQGNFVLARPGPVRAAWMVDALAGLGIGIRRFSGSLEGSVRIGMPTDPDDLERLVHGVRAALRPEAVLYDMDGVLVDVRGSYRAAIQHTAAAFGIRLTQADIVACKAAGDANNDWRVTQRLLAARGVDVPLDEVTKTFEDLLDSGLWAEEQPVVHDGELVSDLRRGIVTGRPRRDAERTLARFGWAFDALVTLEDAPAKPDPAPVRHALAQLEVQSAWMIGDTPDDIRAARAAGVVPIGVCAPGEDVADALLAAGAARVVGHPREVADLLTALRGAR
jgi:histidinol-phosphate aminotransferase